MSSCTLFQFFLYSNMTFIKQLISISTVINKASATIASAIKTLEKEHGYAFSKVSMCYFQNGTIGVVTLSSLDQKQITQAGKHFFPDFYHFYHISPFDAAAAVASMIMMDGDLDMKYVVHHSKVLNHDFQKHLRSLISTHQGLCDTPFNNFHYVEIKK